MFHGVAGCTLDRSLRSDVCNSYFCSGLGNFVKDAGAASGVMVIAGEGEDAAQVAPCCAAKVVSRGMTAADH